MLSLKQPPKWLRRPVSATFGFGGLLAATSNLQGANGKHQSGVVHLHHIVTEQKIADRAQTLSETAGDREKLEAFCNEKAGQGNSGWKSLQTLFKADSKEDLVQLLGFSKEEVSKRVSEAIKQFPSPPEDTKEKEPDAPKEPSEEGETSTLFPETPGTPSGQAADFFSSMATGALRNPQLDNVIPHKPQAAESSVAATQGSRAPSVRSDIVKNNTFDIYPAGENEIDKLVTQALVLGDFSSAVGLCLASERFADALLLAVRGGPELLQQTQNAYFARRTTPVPFMRLFQSIVTEDLADIVQNADIAEWKTIFVVICTYAKASDFNNLADQLGQRLQYKSQIAAQEDSIKSKQYRQDATLCFLAARRLEKVVGIWIDELREEEQSSAETRYTAHAQALQSFIEKVSVFTAATGYVDEELNVPTESAQAAEAGARTYRLAGLYDRYYEYADLLATQGLVDIAARFVQKTPVDYKGTGAAGGELDKARDRLFRAAGLITESRPSKGPQTRPSAYAPAPAASIPSAYAPASVSTASATYAPPPTSAPGPLSYQPLQSSQPLQPAQQTYGHKSYTPAQNYQANSYMPSTTYGSEPQTYGATYAAPPVTTLPPPPRATQPPNGATPPPIPAAQRRDMPGWNDAPSLSAPKRSSSTARETPKPAPIMSPFPHAQQEPQGFQASIHGNTPPPPRAAQPGLLPPPPKGGPRPPSAQALAKSMAGPTPNAQPPMPNQPQQAPPPRGPPRAGPPPGAIAGPPPRALSPLGPLDRQPPPSLIGQPLPPQAPTQRQTSGPPSAPPSGTLAGPPPMRTSNQQPIQPMSSPSSVPAPLAPAASAKQLHRKSILGRLERVDNSCW